MVSANTEKAMTAFLRWVVGIIFTLSVECKWVIHTSVPEYEIKKKEGTETVYQDSGVYHHAVSYCDIGHISADFRNDAYDFMARDKLDVKSKKRLRYFPRLRYAGSR